MAVDDVGPREVQVLVAALVLRSTEVGRRQVARLDHRAHGAVEHEHATREGLA